MEARMSRAGSAMCGAPRGWTTARVIEMHVREENVFHRLARDVERRERREQPRHRMIGAHVDKCRTSLIGSGAPAVHDDVRGRKAWPDVIRIDGRDSVRM